MTGWTKKQSLRDTTKAVLRGNFIAMSTYIKNSERYQINTNDTPEATRKVKITLTPNY
jgi:hypothetical protein